MEESKKSRSAIIGGKGHIVSTATIQYKDLETVKNRLIVILDNNFHMSDKKTGKSIDIDSRLPASGDVGDTDYYHIYVSGRINGTTVPNLITFELLGAFGEYTDVNLAASYSENEPYLEKFGHKIIQKLQPVEQSKRHGKPTMQLKTERSLQQLRQIRRACIENNRPIPKRIAALGQAGITGKTVIIHYPELWARWFDKDYK